MIRIEILNDTKDLDLTDTVKELITTSPRYDIDVKVVDDEGDFYFVISDREIEDSVNEHFIEREMIQEDPRLACYFMIKAIPHLYCLDYKNLLKKKCLE